MADLLCNTPTIYPIPQNRFMVVFPEKTAVDGCVVSKVNFGNENTLTMKMFSTENFKEVVKLSKNKELGTLQIIFIDRMGVKTIEMSLYGVLIKSIYPFFFTYGLCFGDNIDF